MHTPKCMQIDTHMPVLQGINTLSFCQALADSVGILLLAIKKERFPSLTAPQVRSGKLLHRTNHTHTHVERQSILCDILQTVSGK